MNIMRVKPSMEHTVTIDRSINSLFGASHG
jgi:hypothetical protein